MRSAGVVLVFDWEERPRAHQAVDEGSHLYPIPTNASDVLVEYLERVNADVIEEGARTEALRAPPRRRTGDRLRLARLSIEVRAFLMFPDFPSDGEPRFRLLGDAPLYRDTQSVLFVSTVRELLPALRQHSMRQEHDALIPVLLAHSLIVWQADPAHQQHLRGLLFDELGDSASSLEARRQAFWLTPVTSHDYMTKAQILWSHLLDVGMKEQAEAFVLHLYRTAPPEYLDEIHEMIRDTFATYSGGARVPESGQDKKR
jgi:hypothetical protein